MWVVLGHTWENIQYLPAIDLIKALDVSNYFLLKFVVKQVHVIGTEIT